MATKAYLKRYGVDLSPWSSQGIFLEKKITSMEFDNNALGNVVRKTISLEYPLTDTLYMFFTYTDGVVTHADDDRFHGGRGAPSLLVIPSFGNQIIVECNNADASSLVTTLCIFRLINNTDADVKKNFYFNVYNDEGNLFYTYNKPPLIITDIIAVSAEWVNSWVAPPSVGRYIEGNFKDKMIMTEIMGMTNDGYFPTVATPRLTDTNLATNVHTFVHLDDSRGETAWSRQIVLARRV